MSSPENGDGKSSVSSAGSRSDDSSSEHEEFPIEQPRKKRRFSPSDEDLSKTNSRRPIEPNLSRIKSKKNGLQSGPSPISKSVNPVTVAREKTSFASLNVKPWLVASLANMAITRPTAIQKESIPEILEGRDCIGGSRTGSGKTVAFAVPMLQKWAEDREYLSASTVRRILM